VSLSAHVELLSTFRNRQQKQSVHWQGLVETCTLAGGSRSRLIHWTDITRSRNAQFFYVEISCMVPVSFAWQSLQISTHASTGIVSLLLFFYSFQIPSIVLNSFLPGMYLPISAAEYEQGRTHRESQ
jgi:hypothetical protein